jgi:alpha-L-fucosidase
VVREVEQACRRAGLEFGVYLSPWDRNSAQYGSPEYVTDVYRPQLRELLTNYGEVFETWFDGANGGDGFYGGARERRAINNRTYYDWATTWAMVRELQPDTCIFSDAGPDVRWVGNEAGVAGDPCWYTIDNAQTVPGQSDHKRLNAGDRHGPDWLVPECDVSIRHGWFYHAAEDDRVRTPRNLVDLYYASVGRGATFLLNLPPDRRGLIPDIDRASLAAFRKHLDRTFAENLLRDRPLAWTHQADGSWAATVTLPVPVQASVFELREEIARGQRVDRWTLEASDDGVTWRTLATAQSVGHRRLVRFPATVGRAFRITIHDSFGGPLIHSAGLYLEPDLVDAELPSVTGLRVVNPTTVSQPSASEVLIDLGEVKKLRGLRYSARADHRADRYAISLATEPGQWATPVEGEFGNTRFNAAPQVVSFDDAPARYVRFTAARFCIGDQVAAADVEILVGF